MTLDTPRLTMRLPVEPDAEPLHAIHLDPEVVRFIQMGPNPSITGAWTSLAAILGHWQLRGYGQWTLVEKTSNDVIGRVGLWNPAGWPGIELGWIIKRSHWRQGFAREATSAALDWTWRHVETDRVISQIHPDNFPSTELARAIGMSFESTSSASGSQVHIYSIKR
jgi:RimJ/RimL family protein N-acetyltransferase